MILKEEKKNPEWYYHSRECFSSFISITGKVSGVAIYLVLHVYWHCLDACMSVLPPDIVILSKERHGLSDTFAHQMKPLATIP